jgi:hypothetical protein
MAPRIPLRRSVLPLVLATAMAAGSSIATSALGPGPSRPVATVAPHADSALAIVGWTASSLRGAPSAATRPGLYRFAQPASTRAAQPKVNQPKLVPKPPPKAPPKPAAKPKPAKAAPRPVVHVTIGSAYKGHNHFWMGGLGINHAVSWYPCGAASAPGLGLYRWGCAGANNIYLLAHAYTSFRTLHDAYVNGRLRTGMRATYADGAGEVRTYAVVWWRLTTPDRGGFAYAAQSRPSMTLQTCVGAHSEYRLIVRLVAVD